MVTVHRNAQNNALWCKLGEETHVVQRIEERRRSWSTVNLKGRHSPHGSSRKTRPVKPSHSVFSNNNHVTRLTESKKMLWARVIAAGIKKLIVRLSVLQGLLWPELL